MVNRILDRDLRLFGIYHIDRSRRIRLRCSSICLLRTYVSGSIHKEHRNFELQVVHEDSGGSTSITNDLKSVFLHGYRSTQNIIRRTLDFTAADLKRGERIYQRAVTRRHIGIEIVSMETKQAEFYSDDIASTNKAPDPRHQLDLIANLKRIGHSNLP